jgi:hypothetical protein
VGEWESINKFLKELGLCPKIKPTDPKIKPTDPTLAQVNRQGYVVIEELLTLGTILGSPSGSTNQGTNANWTIPNQNESPCGRVSHHPPEPKWSP